MINREDVNKSNQNKFTSHFSDLVPRIITSGAYVYYKRYFVFQVGPTKSGDRLGVVRLGGHLEGSETALEAAQREVFEESSLLINPVETSAMVMINLDVEEPVRIEVKNELLPLLLMERPDEFYSVMYLSHAINNPKLSSETKGLIFLTPNQVHQICDSRITLRDYLNNDGLVMLRTDINEELVLEPFPQLRFLSFLLKQESKLMNNFMKSKVELGEDVYE